MDKGSYLGWDEHSQENSALEFFGSSIVPADSDQSHYIRGNTLEELAANIAQRLVPLRSLTGGLELADDFVGNLRAAVSRWNDMAEKGVDEDFHRGERPVELYVFGGPVGDEPEKKNPLMYPISTAGPYYACLLAGGTLDTKGGPKVTPNAQVVDDLDRPIPGLYGVGNCVAGATARAYWAGGSTLGPMIGFAQRAAQSIHAEPARSL